MSSNLSAQIACPSQKDKDFDEKRLHWTYVVRGLAIDLTLICSMYFSKQHHSLIPFKWRAKSPICPVNFFVTLMHRWRKQGIKYRIFRLVFLSDCFTLLMFFGAITMEHYCKNLMGVVVFAKVQGQVKFECPRTRRHHFSARAYFLHKK